MAQLTLLIERSRAVVLSAASNVGSSSADGAALDAGGQGGDGRAERDAEEEDEARDLHVRKLQVCSRLGRAQAA